MKSVKECYKIFRKYNITENEVQILSFGNGGCFLLYINTNNNLCKLKISHIGVTRIPENKLENIIKTTPIRNKITKTEQVLIMQKELDVLRSTYDNR